MPVGSVANPPSPALADAIASVVAAGLAEDVGQGDVTTDAIVPAAAVARAEILVKAPGVVAGLEVAAAVFRAISPAVEFQALVADGTRSSADEVPAVVARLTGPTRALLTGERLALNLLGRLSGVATLTRRYVDEVAGTGVTLLDTRKTTPGLRALEKAAVVAGGGTNHRLGLFDAILIKDNHIAAAGGVAAAVALARAARPDLPIEVEADTLDQVAAALAAGADRILLDNMSLASLRDAVALVGGRVPLEASGGVSLATIRAIAETGVSFISVGALTHSAVALDVSLEVRS
jgi:nicotinate-nucleotide pyrophosphorylase (carboxylating)